MEPSTVTQTRFDEFYAMQRGKLTYPSVCIEEPGDELVVLLQGMPEGDLPVIIPHGNRLVELMRIQKSPIIIKRLLKLYELTILSGSDSEPQRVKSVVDLLEVGGFDWTR